MYESFEKETKTYSIKEIKYDDISIGDTIQFGEKRSNTYDRIEWIVLDKNNNENKLLLLSKNGFDVIHNYALINKIKKN